MRQLLLLRHAKSSWDDAGVRDHDRVLNERGELTAPRMGRLLVELDLVPDRLLTSSALRARRTADLVAIAAGLDPASIICVEDLYLAPPAMIVDLIRRKGGDAARLLVVAHNPGLEELVASLAGQSEAFPTAALAALSIDIDDWNELALLSPARIDGIWRPRELGRC